MGLSNFAPPPSPPQTPPAGNIPANISIPGMPAASGNGGSGQKPDELVNLNKKPHTDTKFREPVLRQMIAVLIGKHKPNVCLTGHAGTGKTAVVEELAYRIHTKHPQIPQHLQNKTIYSLQISDLNAGAMFNGDVEERVKEVLAFLENPKNNAILFLDELHQLMSGDPAYRKIAQILKPALSRGSIKVIGATTTQEARKLSNDPAFNRRFTRILVDELTKQQTVEILKGISADMVKHYGQTFLLTDDMTNLIVNTADEFCSAGSHRPDNAITLLDRSLADAVLQKNDMLNSPDPVIRAAAQAAQGIILSETSIKKTAVKLASGNNEPEEFDEEKLRNDLIYIKGQDAVKEPIIRIMKRHTAHIRPQTKPLTMLFMGPSGCGKTEMAKIISKNYLNQKPIILNMTEYSHDSDINRIIGAPPGYVGYNSDAEMVFDPLEANPYQVILLDEFEKADKAVQKLFMRVFDEGTLETNKGNTIDFTKSIIIATTNAGCMYGEQSDLGFVQTKQKEPDDAQIIKALEQYFNVELLNRFSRRYRFCSIDRDAFINILKEEYVAQVQDIKNISPRAPLADTLDDADAQALADKYYNKKFNARPAKEAVQEFIDETLIP